MYVALWLRHYATAWKVAGSRSDEVDDFLTYVILLVALGPRVYSASNRN
jgi:prolipoprotein diacylglyceryltransferase